jgi:hypothetical protein
MLKVIAYKLVGAFYRSRCTAPCRVVRSTARWSCARLLDAEGRDVKHNTKSLLIFEIGIGERQAVVGGKQRARKSIGEEFVLQVM